MSSLLYFAIIGIYFTNSLATQDIPLKCAFRIFGTDAETASTNEGPTTNSLEFGVVKLDSHKIDQDGWVFELKNIEIKGMDDAILDEFSYNFVTNSFQITFHTDLFISYDYKTDGYILSKPIFGEGLLTSRLDNTKIGMNIPFDFKENNGDKFMELRDFDLWYNMKNAPELNLSNLYNGDKELSDSMHSLLKENMEYVSSKFGKEFMDKLGEQIFNVLKKNILANSVRDFSSC